MQQFTVPQFIDVEDKIIGPITTRQFVILLVEAVLVAIFYKLFYFPTFIISTILSFIITITFSFVKVNGRPFHFFILNVFQTLGRPGLRVWNHMIGRAMDDYKEIAAKEVVETKVVRKDLDQAPAYTSSRLAELSLIVDTHGSYQGENKGSHPDIKSI